VIGFPALGSAPRSHYDGGGVVAVVAVDQKAMAKRVLLNVYDLHESNDALNPLGLGFYHSGVEIEELGYEWSFSSFGVQRSKPRLPEFGKLREQIDMGTFVGALQDINVVINRLTDDGFKGTQYDLVAKNCNAFSERFCVELVGKSIPGWVNRAASIGQSVGYQQPAFPAPPPTTAASAPAATTATAPASAAQQPSSSTSVFSWLFGGWGAETGPATQVAAKPADPSKKKELTEQQRQLLNNLKKK